MPPSSIQSLECAFLSAFSAPQVLLLLQKSTAYSNLPLTPIWLNHHIADETHYQQHSVIGLLPMTSFVYELCDVSQTHSVKSSSASVVKKCVVHSHSNFKSLKQWQSAKTVTFTQVSDYQNYLTNNTGNQSPTVNKQKNGQVFKFEFTHKDAGYRQFAEYLIDYCSHSICRSSTQPDSLPKSQPQDNQQKTDTHYHHGLMGFVSYDASAMYLTDDVAKQYLETDSHDDKYPLAYFGHYPLFLSVTLCNISHPQTRPIYQWQLHAKNAWAVSLLNDVRQLLQQIIQAEPVQAEQSPSIHTSFNTRLQVKPPPLTLKPLWKKVDYQHAFNQVQKHLLAGDCYQINLTQCWQGHIQSQKSDVDTIDVDAINANNNPCLVDYLPKLYANTHAPFAGYFMLTSTPSFIHHSKGFELLSCSPELFVQFQLMSSQTESPLKVITKPIKGTRPRGKTLAEDQALFTELAHSEKDLAENVMIVDLLRNDLGKYAQTGSVTVPKRFAIESFSNVHHMVSTVTATLKPNAHPIWVLFDSLPAGSITGTPKKRSVELIQQLETAPRKAYCGTLGYLNFDGTGMFNVLIRTLQAQNHGKVELWAGGGITVASDCKSEWQECHDKIANLLNTLAN